MFDESHDEVLDAREFMNFVVHNDTVRNTTDNEDNTEGDNQLMRYDTSSIPKLNKITGNL